MESSYIKTLVYCWFLKKPEELVLYCDLGTHFIPTLGPAPKWCSFIENLTEELEEKQTETIYNEYKFLSREELDKIKASDMIGTKYLESYMHGFIMKAKLYNKLKDKAQPFDYAVYREEQIQNKLNKDLLKDKIFSKIQKAKVNQKLIEKTKIDSEKGFSSSGKAKPTVLEDDRFKDMFQDEDFEKDETNEDYLLRNPSAAAKLKKKKVK